MIRFKEGQRYPDYTSEWYVYLDKPYTVGQFIKAILKERPYEWGYITIYNDIYNERKSCKYYNGVLTNYEITPEISRKPIQSVGCTGAFNNKDYIIELKEED